MEFVEYKCLESLLIEGEGIAQEGLFDKFNKKKKNEESNKVEQTKINELAKTKFSVIKSIVNKVISKVKSKYRGLPYDCSISTDDDNGSLYFNVFKDPDIAHQSSSKYKPEAEECFEYIWEELENALDENNSLIIQGYKPCIDADSYSDFSFTIYYDKNT